MRLDETAQLFGDVDRREVKRHACAPSPAPSARWPVSAVIRDQRGHAHGQSPRPDGERRKPGVILGRLDERSGQFIERRLQAFERLDRGGGPLARIRNAPATFRQGRPANQRDDARASAQTTATPRFAPARQQFRRQIARQRLQLPARHGEAEEIRGDVRQLMRLVNDDRIGARQQIAETFLFQHEIGHEQVMIHDHDVRRLRFTPRLDDVAAVEERAVGAEAVVACRGDPRPYGVVLAAGARVRRRRRGA